MNKFFKFLTGSFIIVVFTILLVLLRAFVLTKLWGWFVVPLFNAPKLSYAFAIGLSLVVGMFTGTISKKKQRKEGEDHDESWTEMFAASVVNSIVPLLVGWIVHLFI